MKKLFLAGAFLLIFVCGIYGKSFAKNMDIKALVDNFQKGTDLQKEQILKDNLNKAISASGIVTNAGEYDFFDIVTDLKGTYCQVSTGQQKTKNNTPYQVIFLFRDKDLAKDMDKGRRIQKEGKIIRIIDERLQISLWIFCGELTKEDSTLFK
ncbi:MAG: hypothetical protein WC628_09080 [Candidatus Omnitrophota bacterium]